MGVITTKTIQQCIIGKHRIADRAYVYICVFFLEEYSTRQYGCEAAARSWLRLQVFFHSNVAITGGNLRPLYNSDNFKNCS